MIRILLTISAVVATAGNAMACPGGEALDFWSALFWNILQAIATAGGYWR